MFTCERCKGNFGLFSFDRELGLCRACRALEQKERAEALQTSARAVTQTLELSDGAIQAASTNGMILLDRGIIRIRHTMRVSTFLNQGVQGERFIVARSVTAIEFREPGSTSAGFIAFDFPGKNPLKGGIFDAAADENALIFSSHERDDFCRLRDAVLDILAAPHLG